MRVSEFVGRDEDLARLSEELTRVALSGRGRFVLIRGRRRVGKSRLVEEFLREHDGPTIFFTASRQTASRELELFSQALAGSELAASSVLRSGTTLNSWEGALNLIATTAGDTPTVVVIDEFPYLVEQDTSIEGTFQKVWDRALQNAPILLILIGSDLTMMEALNAYGRPLYGRPTRAVVVTPFSPREVQKVVGLGAAEAMDAYLAVGGFPLIAQSWKPGESLWDFLGRSMTDPTSPLIVDGERMLASEFPVEVQARRVLSVIGSGETTFSAISRAAGIPATSLQRSLEALIERKRVVAATVPLSSKRSRDRRYSVADPYLRFWLTFIERGLDEIERGRGTIVLERVKERWSTFSGQAVEPIVRESVARLLPDDRFGSARYVGSYWTRSHDLEVDLVTADRERLPDRISGVGSIKWRGSAPFRRRDRDDLVSLRAGVPGTDRRTGLIGVSRLGFRDAALDVALTPEDLIQGW